MNLIILKKMKKNEYNPKAHNPIHQRKCIKTKTEKTNSEILNFAE